MRRQSRIAARQSRIAARRKYSAICAR